MNPRRGLLGVWVFLTFLWVIGMGFVAVSDGVPEPILNCHTRPSPCTDMAVVNAPVRTLYPRTVLWVASAVAIPAVALILGFVVTWMVRVFAPQDNPFGNTLIVSIVLAVLSVIAEAGALWLLVSDGGPIVPLIGHLALISAILCAMVFVAGLFLFGRKGLWLSLPMIATFIPPVGLVLWLTVSVYNCEHDAHVHTMCMP